MELPSLTLVMVQGPRKGETLEFRPGSTIRIGRLVRGNTVPIKDDGISSKHLSIESSLSGPGKWILRDLDSSNGTLLNATKLLPDTPYDLRGGDSIKIGEYTSILVKIDSHEESQLRRNPRRRASEKETLEPVVDNRGRRGKPSKESEAKCDEKGEELETGNRRKGPRRKARLLKTEVDAEELCDQGPENVGPVEGKPVRQTSKRCTRSTKNEESIVFDRVLRKIPKNSGLECGEVEIKVKKTRPGARTRMNLRKESPDCTQVDAVENKENVKDTNLEEIIRIDVGRDAARGVDASRNEEMTNQTNLEENDQINVDEGAISEIDENVERGASHGAREEGSHGVREEGLDLANMTLGDWLDYLEVHLPKHIIDSTEEMIEGMRQKADRVRQYIVEQTTQRSKVPVR